MTFRFKILLGFMGVALLMAFAIVFYANQSAFRWEQEMAIGHISDNTRHVLEDVELFMRDCQAELAVMALSNVLTDPSTDRERLNQRLIDYRNAYGKYDRITLYDGEGVIIADSGGLDIGATDRNFCWKEASRGRSGYELELAACGTASHVHFYAGMRNATGATRRVLISHVSLSRISGLVHGFDRFNRPGLPPLRIQLIRADGRLFYSSLGKRGIFEVVDEWPRLKPMADALASGKIESQSIEEADRLSIVSRSAANPSDRRDFWILSVQAPKALLFGEIWRRGRAMLAIAFLIIAGSMVLIGFISGTLSRPLADLVHHSRMLAGGDFSQFKNLTERSDEFGELVRGFKGMAEKLALALQGLRDREERFRAIFDNSGDAILIHDLSGRQIHANQAALDRYGYSSDELAALSFQAIDTPAQARFIPERIARLERDGRAFFETEHRTKDGRIVPTEINARLFRIGDEKLIISNCRDITERKRTEAELGKYREHLEELVANRTTELRAVNQELQAVNRELEGFAYSVSHDLRAPLRSMDGFSQALLEDYGDRLDPAGRDYLQRIRNGAQNMGRLIDGLLELSRATRGELKKESVNLSELAREAARELQRTDPHRRVEWAIEPERVVKGDPRLLKSAMVNLLDNAWKFTSRRKEARIGFGRATDPKAARIWELDTPIHFVRDNGAGFDRAYAGNLFGAFQRLHRQDEFPGTGIGLATVQRIIHRHGGRIWAEGEVDRGATFYFTL